MNKKLTAGFLVMMNLHGSSKEFYINPDQGKMSWSEVYIATGLVSMASGSEYKTKEPKISGMILPKNQISTLKEEQKKCFCPKCGKMFFSLRGQCGHQRMHTK